MSTSQIPRQLCGVTMASVFTVTLYSLSSHILCLSRAEINPRHPYDRLLTYPLSAYPPPPRCRLHSGCYWSCWGTRGSPGCRDLSEGEEPYPPGWSGLRNKAQGCLERWQPTNATCQNAWCGGEERYLCLTFALFRLFLLRTKGVGLVCLCSIHNQSLIYSWGSIGWL